MRHALLFAFLALGGTLGAQTAGAPQNATPVEIPQTWTAITSNASAVDFTPLVEINYPDHLLLIRDDKKDLLVSVGRDGKITYGDGYKPDAAAKQFWETLAKDYPIVCDKPNERNK